MAPGPNSYGSTAEVAALVPRYAGEEGDFTAGTRPTIIQVENLINQVSGIINSFLSRWGFSIPVTQADVVLSLEFFVIEEVAAICEGINGSGRFGPTADRPAPSRFGTILKDAKLFVEENALGFERLGAARTYSESAGIGFRDTDNSGDATFPLFERDHYGPSGFFTEDDST